MTDGEREKIENLYDDFEDMASSQIEVLYEGELDKFNDLPIEKRLELRQLILSNIIRVALIKELQNGVNTFEQTE